MENKSSALLRGTGIFFIAAIFCAGFSAIAYNEGNQIGFDEGHGIGYGEGHGIGYGEGHGIGYGEGNETGYTQGREDGIPKAFTSVGELREWLRQDDTDNQRWIETYHDCEDFAMDLVNAANEDGYTMYIVAGNDLDGRIENYMYTWRYEIYGEEWIKVSELRGHAWNYVVINGGIYFIEPQTDEVYYWGVEI